jgi:hypothetical protein
MVEATCVEKRMSTRILGSGSDDPRIEQNPGRIFAENGLDREIRNHRKVCSCLKYADLASLIRKHPPIAS